MPFGFHSFKSQIGILLLLLSMAGCTALLTPTPSVEVQVMPTAEASFVAPVPTSSSTESPAEVIVPSPTAGTVVITASKGNLNIRRGPGISYNPISVLKNGQSATAHGRDLLANWVMVDIPDGAGQTGWVRTETDYSEITGDIDSLPEVVVDFAVPAYVQNCTYHLMVLQPGDIPVSSLRAFPDNDARVYPGEYTVYDDDVPDTPEVMTINVKEGMLIDIDVDGNSEHHKCP
jgi:uncharacterized protein YraI